MKKYKKIYFVGIKGVGMAPIAIIAKQAKFEVAGSDVSEEFITDAVLKKEGIHPLIGFNSDNVKKFVALSKNQEVLVIATAAHGGFKNPEASFAQSIGIKVISHGQAVGYFMSGELFGRKDFERISVAGAHGKTTITALLASCFSSLGLDPSYTVGTSEIFPVGSAGHFGRGKYFIAEADEYAAEIEKDRTPKFLYQYPKFLIINNIDFDHPDFYNSIDEIVVAFEKLTLNVQKNGTLLVNGDDLRIKEVVKIIRKDLHVITYGVSQKNDFCITQYAQEEFSSHFTVFSKGINIGRFTLSVPGFHNAKNALSAIALLLEIGVSVQKIQEILPQFGGTKRRSEKVGITKNGALVIDDYAHHPLEIQKTLSTLRTAFGQKKIICIFQPHTFSRTLALLSEFSMSFADCDSLIFLPTFASARDEISDEKEYNQKIKSAFAKVEKNVKILEKGDDVVEYISQNFDNSSNILITMGAGDIYKVGYKLINK